MAEAKDGSAAAGKENRANGADVQLARTPKSRGPPPTPRNAMRSRTVRESLSELLASHDGQGLRFEASVLPQDAPGTGDASRRWGDPFPSTPQREGWRRVSFTRSGKPYMRVPMRALRHANVSCQTFLPGMSSCPCPVKSCDGGVVFQPATLVFKHGHALGALVHRQLVRDFLYFHARARGELTSEFGLHVRPGAAAN
jgi:hypothetical protein